MADALHGDAGLAVNRLLKIEDAKHLFNGRFELPDPPPPPSPDLRADKIDDRYVTLLELLRQAQVEIGEVNEDGKLWLPPAHLIEEDAKGPVDAREPRDDFCDSSHGD